MANYIKKLRLEARLYQTELAKLAGLSRETIRQIEKRPKLKESISTCAIAEALKCTLKDLGVSE